MVQFIGFLTVFFIIGIFGVKADKTITISPGESLWEIAKKHLENPEKYMELLKFNNISSVNELRPGDKLVIPASLMKKAAKPIRKKYPRLRAEELLKNRKYDASATLFIAEVYINPFGADVLALLNRALEGMKADPKKKIEKKTEVRAFLAYKANDWLGSKAGFEILVLISPGNKKYRAMLAAANRGLSGILGSVQEGREAGREKIREERKISKARDLLKEKNLTEASFVLEKLREDEKTQEQAEILFETGYTISRNRFELLSKGIKLYMDSKWQEAFQAFEIVYDEFPTDTTAPAYLKDLRRRI